MEKIFVHMDTKSFVFKNQYKFSTIDCWQKRRSFLSAAASLLIKQKNKLHTTELGDMPLMLTKLEPHINKLLKLSFLIVFF